jgi:tetratricopeptide (TPR) repeat protein
MKFGSMMCAASVCCGLLSGTAFAGMELYTGTMEIVTVSGKACGGLQDTQAVSLFLRRDRGGVSGYFEGPGITTGKFSGKDQARLEVRYPYHDDLRASGHFLSIAPDGRGLRAELRDRHLGPSEEDCNFDLARLHLKPAEGSTAAESRLKPVAALFEAQLMRSEALGLTRQGRYGEALPLYEKALAMADPAANGNADLIAPYLVGLAGTYVKLGRQEPFNRLYDERIASIRDEEVRDMLTAYRIRSLLQTGKAALQAEDYGAALENFRRAYRLHPHNAETVAAVMMTQVRMQEYDKAIAFLEEVLTSAENEGERQDLRRILAQIHFLRARNYERNNAGAKAAADLERADTLDPQSVQYLIARARLRHKQGSLAEAEKLLQQGLERFPLEPSRQEIIAARDRMRTMEAILGKLRQGGS